MNSTSTLATAEDFADWLTLALSTALKLNADDLETSATFDQYGVDSVLAVELTGQLEARTGKKLPPTLMYDYPTIGTLSEHLRTLVAGK